MWEDALQAKTQRCSLSWIQQEREKASQAFLKKSVPQLLGIMSFLNTAAFFAALNAKALTTKEYKVIKDHGDGIEELMETRLDVEPHKFQALLNGSIAGTLEVVFTNKWQRKHNKSTWDGYCRSGGGIRAARQTLADYGLFEFDAVEAGSTVVPPTLRNLDIFRMLIAYEVCERILLETKMKHDEDGELRYFTIDDLPCHKGALMVTLFNAAFDGVAEYRREEEVTERSREPMIEPQLNTSVGVCQLVVSIAKEFWQKRFRVHNWGKRKKTHTRSLIPPHLELAIPF